MFGSLKKKLQDAIKKISGSSSGPDASAASGAAKEIEQAPDIKPQTNAYEETEKSLEEKIEEYTKEGTVEKEAEEIEQAVKTDSGAVERGLKRFKEEEKIPPEIQEKEEQKILAEVKEEIKPDTFSGVIEKPPVAEPSPTLKQSILDRLLKKEKKDIEISVKKEIGLIEGVLKRVTEKKLTEEDVDKFLSDLKMAMLENDTALEAAEKICSSVKAELLDTAVKRGAVEKTIQQSLRSAMLSVMEQEGIDVDKKISESKEPFVIMVLGFNGVGKTTTMAKLAHKFKKYNPVFAAGDTFRAASIEQLEEHAKRLGIDVIKHKYGSDSAAVIFDAKKHALAAGKKLVLADTAGRSHSNVNLMDELKKVVRVNKPDLKLLILDSMTGNDIYEQSRLFNEAVGVDAIILTKADVYEKGGAALSAAYTIKKPILFLGTGQNYADLREFSPEEVVRMLLE